MIDMADILSIEFAIATKVPVNYKTAFIRVRNETRTFRMMIGADPSNYEDIEIDRIAPIGNQVYRFGYGERSNTVIFYEVETK